jgi:hypothetical protein
VILFGSALGNTCKYPIRWLWMKGLLKDEVILKISVIASRQCYSTCAPQGRVYSEIITRMQYVKGF